MAVPAEFQAKHGSDHCCKMPTEFLRQRVLPSGFHLLLLLLLVVVVEELGEFIPQDGDVRDGADEGAPAIQSLHRVLCGWGRGTEVTESQWERTRGLWEVHSGAGLCNSKGKPELSVGLGFAALISPCFDTSKAFPGCLFRDFFGYSGPRSGL